MDPSLLQKLEDDDVFRQFLKQDFDVKIYASQFLQGALVSELLAKLVAGINLLDKELHNQVAAHHEDLLSQATSTETLEGVLVMMQSRIQTLLSAVERLRTKIVEPYTKVAKHTAMLSRLQTTCDLLRCVLRFHYLTKCLDTQMQGGERQITKAAQSLNELDYLMKSADLSGLDVIDRDQKFIRQARKDVENQAEIMLEKGMDSQNQAQVATALQVFHNLGILLPTIQRHVDTIRTGLQQSVHNALDVALLTQTSQELFNNNNSKPKGAPGRAAIPSVGNSVAFRATLWTNMEKLIDQIYLCCIRVQHLQRVLAKKRDPVTHVCFLDEIAKDGENSIFSDFWTSVIQIIRDEFTNAANESTYINQAFEGEFPKLLRYFSDLWHRLERFSPLSNTDAVVILHQDMEGNTDQGKIFEFVPDKALRSTLSQFENAYLSRSLSRLFDPINLMFSGSDTSIPSKTEVDSIIQIISKELSVASVDPELCKTIAKNVAKTIQLFIVKCEQMLSTDGEASQVIDPPTSGQTLNANIVNLLNLFHQQASKVLQHFNNFPVEAINSISQVLQSVLNLMDSAIQPLLMSIDNAIEAIILTMHQEDFSTPAPDNSKVSNNTPCSLYMKELQGFIARASSQYLSQYHCSDFIMKSLHPLACRSINQFVQHASLIRPLGSGGKLRLAADFAQMELAVAPFCVRIIDLGQSYRMLRSVRPLLFQTPEHIAQSPALGHTIPYSVGLHFLFARAPEEIRSPHQTAGWSLSRYSQWLEEHPSEKDRLSLIRGALEAYVQSVKQRQDKEFAPIYPIMLQLLQKGLKDCNT